MREGDDVDASPVRADPGARGSAVGGGDPEGSVPRPFPELGFSEPVARGGYAWWYLDALSDDGRRGLTVIAFVGSVFSPYYALARARAGGADPDHHCALNVALYGDAPRWTMTERGRDALRRDRDSLRIGPSAVRREGRDIVVEIDEVAVPWPRRVRGRLRLTPGAITGMTVTLNADGRHLWRPLAPASRIEVEMETPRQSWSGHAYLDANRGDAPLADGFRRWSWCRAPHRDGAVVLYDGSLRSGAPFGFGLAFDADGAARPLEPPPEWALKPGFWRVPRRVQGETRPRLARVFEDAPFYTRSLVATRIAGQEVEAVHESLDLDRFRSPVVLAMLPFRMPRRA